MASSEAFDNCFIPSTSIIFFPRPDIWFDFFEFVIFLIPLCVPFRLYNIVNIWRQVLKGHAITSSCRLDVSSSFFFYLRFRFQEYLRVQISSTVPLCFLVSVNSLWCASVFVLLGWSEFGF